jgi:SAM-dependent MidA family methyltransferase
MLLLPSEMGTRFKVMALGRDAQLPPGSFAMRDERHLL